VDLMHDHWPVAVARRARALGLIGSDAHLILGGPDRALAERKATQDVAELLRLVASIPSRFFDGDFGRFAWAHGFDAEEADVLQWNGPPDLTHYFARGDLACTQQGFKLLELNVGGAVGGMAYASMPVLTGVDSAQDAPLRAWARYVAGRVRGHGRGAIVEDAALLPEQRWVLELNAKALAEACGVPVDVVSQDDIACRGDAVWAAGQRVGWLYPIVCPRDVCSDARRYRELREAICSGKVVLPFHQGVQALGSKLLLATLWELHDRHALAPAEALLVDRLVPVTRRLTPEHLAWLEAEREQWVLKPALGLGGAGVCIGGELDASAWAQALHRALDGEGGPHVVQRRCQPLAEDVVVGLPDGGIDHYPAHCVWGLHVADGERSGDPTMRCRPTQGTLVINYANGAAAGMFRTSTAGVAL
jgi:hypothetical protein